MSIAITNGTESTYIIILVLLTVFFLSLRNTEYNGLISLSVSQELKGLAILAIVFAHISYMLVDDHKFLYPLTKGAGTGVDIFLFMSGYGLSVSMLKKPLSALEFYKRRLIKIFIPFWLVLVGLFAADAFLLDRHYSPGYIIQSFLGWFPRNNPYDDVNSPFWYISWMLMFYALFPLFFFKNRLWLTATLLCIIASLIAVFNPLNMATNWWLNLHTFAFSLGMLTAWSLLDANNGDNRIVGKLTQLRSGSVDVKRVAFLTILSMCAAFMSSHNEPKDWPRISQWLNGVSLSDAHIIGQTCSVLAMAALIIVFSMKKLDSRFFALFGAYSYEIYLLHWPLMARYDVFFHTLPASIAMFSWLLTLLAASWVLQRTAQFVGTWVDSKW